MRFFTCECCRNKLHFENVGCVQCGAELGFIQEFMAVCAIIPVGDGLYRRGGAQSPSPQLYRKCRNYSHEGVCNWMVEADSGDIHCLSCQTTRTIPDLVPARNWGLWAKMEQSKRRLIFSLLQFGLRVVPQSVSPQGLAFDFLTDAGAGPAQTQPIMTGHSGGIITINLDEADSVARENMRTRMGEPYRTLLGHFRHESGHYYWDQLVRDSSFIDRFRQIFGDERDDYASSLHRYYDSGSQRQWPAEFISAYASSHPWEDWAETWAHYLHIVDALETAHNYGLSLNSFRDGSPRQPVSHNFDPYHMVNFETLIDLWVPTSVALNSLNRSMGHEMAYPFVLTTAVIEKLAFIHEVIRSGSPGIPTVAAPVGHASRTG